MLEGAVDPPQQTSARHRAARLCGDSTLFGLRERAAARRPDKAALVSGERRLSDAEPQPQGTRLAARPLGLGLVPRDRVLMQLPNMLGFAVVYFALACIGAIPVLALRTHRHAEVRHFLGAPGAVACVIAERIAGFDGGTAFTAILPLGHDDHLASPGLLATRHHGGTVALAASIRRMGDIVRKQGRHVYAEGRRKDFIDRGGEAIRCAEIENLIFAHPMVKAATLVARPDAVFGEKACAFVVLHAGQNLSFDALIDFLRRQPIASFKLPGRLEVVAVLPVRPVGKILQRPLRQAIALKLKQEQGP